MKNLTMVFVLLVFFSFMPVHAEGFSIPGPVLIRLTNGTEIKAEACTQEDDVTLYSLAGSKKVYKISNDEIESISNDYPDSDPSGEPERIVSVSSEQKPDQHVNDTQERLFPGFLFSSKNMPRHAMADPVEFKPLEEQVSTLFYYEQFSELEKMANELKDKKSCFPGGLNKLYYFYDALDRPRPETDENYRKIFCILNKWSEKYPESITERVAEAGTWISYAWFARGNDWASTVTKEGWQLLDIRLKKAYEILTQTDISKTGESPERFALLLQVGIGQGWDRDKFDTTFKSAVSYDPGYCRFYFLKAVYLLPRWEGAPGEWQRFAEEATKMTPASEGMTAYARILLSTWNYGGNGEWDTFDYPGLSWGKMKQGFLDMERNYPDSSWNLNTFALFAAMANDKDTAYDLFQKIGDNPNLGIWCARSRYDLFRKAVTKAHADSQGN